MRKDGVKRAEFIAGAAPVLKSSGLGTGRCRVCPERPAPGMGTRLCERYEARWWRHRTLVPEADFELPRDWFFAPTLLTDVRNSMSVAREEVFGPVLTMLTYDDMDDAVAIP